MAGNGWRERMSENVRVAHEAGVCTITLDRAEKKNALTRDMYKAIADALEAAAKDDAIGCVLITGAGGVFSAGNDIADFRGAKDPNQPRDSSRIYGSLPTYPKPVVAAVDGLAIGIGCTILLHCDLVYCSTEARFRMPFVDLGLVPELGASLLVPQLAGRHKAAELLLLGDFFDAATAQEIGLVNKVFTPEALLGEAMAVAQRLAAKPRHSLRLTKQLMRGGADAVHKRIEEEMVLFRQLLASPETQAIMAGVLKPRR
jgi:enoyl-CoA hydratase/carnithine racemase